MASYVSPLPGAEIEHRSREFDSITESHEERFGLVAEEGFCLSVDLIEVGHGRRPTQGKRRLISLKILVSARLASDSGSISPSMSTLLIDASPAAIAPRIR